MTPIEFDDDRLIILLCAVPFAALLYCAITIGTLLTIPAAQNYPLVFGGVFALIPLVVGAAIWIGPFRK